MAKFSRSKGRRGEQQLVIYLKTLGYQAERILQQYQQAGMADVIARKEGNTYTFEIKCRYGEYKTIYNKYYAERDPDKTLCFVRDGHSALIAISSHFPSLLQVEQKIFRRVDAEDKVYSRIAKMDQLRQSADFLVLKDNGKPRLFLRYWP